MIKRLLALLVIVWLAGPSEAASSRGERTASALIECAPANFESAVECLDANLPVDTRDELSRNGAIGAHFGLGMWLRNNWGLWSDSALQRSLVAQGFIHPDDMSGTILDALVARLRNEPFDLNSKIQYYEAYWAKSKGEQVDGH